MINPTPARVVWSYKIWQPIYDEMKKTKCADVFVKGIPKDLKDCLLIIDDQMGESEMDVRNLFTRGSHHKNITVI